MCSSTAAAYQFALDMMADQEADVKVATKENSEAVQKLNGLKKEK